MKFRIVSFFFLVAFQSVAYGQKLASTCYPVATSSPTIWGGKELIQVDLRNEPMQKMHGLALWSGNEPAAGVLLQVFKRDHTDPLYSPPDKDARQPVAACITDTVGDFFFSLPAGEYELRASMNRKVNVTSVFVIVERGMHRSTPIAVPIREGL